MAAVNGKEFLHVTSGETTIEVISCTELHPAQQIPARYHSPPFKELVFLQHLIILTNRHERKDSATGLMEVSWDFF